MSWDELEEIAKKSKFILSKEDLRNYHKLLREIVTNINDFEKIVARQTKKDNRELKAKERQLERQLERKDRKELRELSK